MKTVTIKISPQGIPTVAASGFPDAGCHAHTRPYVDGLSDGKGQDTVIEHAESSIPAGTESLATAGL